MTGLGFAHGLDAEEFGGDVAHGFFSLLLGLGPARAAEGVQGGIGFACADVFADEMGLADGDVEFWRFNRGVAGGVFDDEALHLRIEGD